MSQREKFKTILALSAFLLSALYLSTPQNALGGNADYGICLVKHLSHLAFGGPTFNLPVKKAVAKYPEFEMDPFFKFYDNAPMIHAPLGAAKYHYFSDREKYRIFFRDGSPISSLGTPLPDGHYLYVMDKFGNFYLGEVPARSWGHILHHSSFLAGSKVSSAGKIDILNGRIKSIDRSSGHYKPSPEALQNALSELSLEGVDPTQITVNQFGDEN